MYGKMMCRICGDPCHGNFRHVSSSHSHTMRVLSDLQWFGEVLAPGTQARSSYHDVSGREPVDCQLSCPSMSLLEGHGSCCGQLWCVGQRDCRLRLDGDDGG